MTTETLSREWLQHQISAIEGAGITDSNTLAAFKLALAAMSSKPVVADEVEHVAAVLELIGSFEATDIDSGGTVAKLAMRQPFVLFKGLTFQKLCLPGAFRPGDHHNKMLRPGLCVVHASPQYL